MAVSRQKAAFLIVLVFILSTIFNSILIKYVERGNAFSIQYPAHTGIIMPYQHPKFCPPPPFDC